MTANQYKRIRTKLERAAILTAEANELATKGHAPPSLRFITARAADNMAVAQYNLAQMDAADQAAAERIKQQMGLA